MRVILVDEDTVAAETIKIGLARHNVVCDTMSCNAEELIEAAGMSHDALIVTVPHNHIDVPQLVAAMRHRRIGMPVIALQSFRNAGEAIALINAGVDDALVKPVTLAELAARLRCIARRVNGHVDVAATVGRITYFFDGRMPMIGDKTVNISRRERELLECLMLRQGRMVERRFIYNYVYGEIGGPISEKTVDVVICKLRKKLRALSGGEEYIQTVPGQGYRFVDPEKVRDEGRRLVVAFDAEAKTGGEQAEKSSLRTAA